MREGHELREQAAKRTKRCAVDGCGLPTRELKPVCPDHVDRMPYMRLVIARAALVVERAAPVSIAACRACAKPFQFTLTGKRVAPARCQPCRYKRAKADEAREQRKNRAARAS